MRTKNAELGCITDVPGVRLGHAQSEAGHTGCSVVLFDEGAVAGVDIGGSAPGTRETEMLHPTNMVMKTHAILLTGGSTFGLAAASGVQAYLQERDIGFHASTGVVIPIVPSACIFDLDVGKPRIYPDHDMGKMACENARAQATLQGGVGVGIGATCGRVLGSECTMFGGVGTASMALPGGVWVGVFVVCNTWGDVVDPVTGEILAGARRAPDSRELLDTEAWLFRQSELEQRYFGMDTTLCVVATNAAFNSDQITKIAMMAQDGIARSTAPSHTLYDGDVVFAGSVGRLRSEVTIVGAAAQRLISRAIVAGVTAAQPAE